MLLVLCISTEKDDKENNCQKNYNDQELLFVSGLNPYWLNPFLLGCSFGANFAQTCISQPLGIHFSQSKDYITLDHVLWTYIPSFGIEFHERKQVQCLP